MYLKHVVSLSFKKTKKTGNEGVSNAVPQRRDRNLI